MPIVSTDLKWYYSGGSGNSDPALSLGGTISSTQITSGQMNNIFDNVNGDEATSGDVEYRAIYVKNTHATLTAERTYVWIHSNTPADDTIAIGIESTKGSPRQSIANEQQSPTGISFSEPSNKSSALSLGNLLPGDVYMIWIRRTVPAQTPAYNNNAFTIRVECDTTA